MADVHPSKFSQCLSSHRFFKNNLDEWRALESMQGLRLANTRIIPLRRPVNIVRREIEHPEQIFFERVLHVQRREEGALLELQTTVLVDWRENTSREARYTRSSLGQSNG